MSQIDKLKVLLARVEQRRAEPRLVAVSNAATQPSANTNVASLASAPAAAASPRAPQLELAPKQPARSVEEAIASAPSSIPPPPAAARPPSLPPLGRTPFPPPPSSTVPPPVQQAAEPLARTPTEVLPPVPLRIAPNPPAQLEPVVRATSPSRIEAPKTFGELLEQSLALRPKAG